MVEIKILSALVELLMASAGTDDGPDWQNLVRLLEENEKVGHLFRCARVQGLETGDGLLLFGKEHLYVADGFTQTPSRKIRDVSNFPPDTFDPIVPPYTTPGYGSSGNGQQQMAVHHCSRLGYEDVREVHKRRFSSNPSPWKTFPTTGAATCWPSLGMTPYTAPATNCTILNLLFLNRLIIIFDF